MYRLEIMFLVKSREGAEDTLSDFDSHVAVSTLCGRRADLFVVEKHDHVDLSVIALFNWELRMLDQSIEGTKGTTQVVESGRRDELFVETNETRWLRIVAVELEINNLISLNIQIVCNQLREAS